jgi:hypothetical protein
MILSSDRVPLNPENCTMGPSIYTRARATATQVARVDGGGRSYESRLQDKII